MYTHNYNLFFSGAHITGMFFQRFGNFKQAVLTANAVWVLAQNNSEELPIPEKDCRGYNPLLDVKVVLQAEIYKEDDPEFKTTFDIWENGRYTKEGIDYALQDDAAQMV